MDGALIAGEILKNAGAVARSGLYKNQGNQIVDAMDAYRAKGSRDAAERPLDIWKAEQKMAFSRGRCPPTRPVTFRGRHNGN